MPEDNRDEDKQQIITIKDDAMYGYVNVIDKVMHKKQPYIDVLIRKKQFENGVYRIKNGYDNKLTPYRIEVLDSTKMLWLNINNDLAKSILGTDQPPIYGNYVRDLRKYLGRHDLSYTNIPILYIHYIKHLPTKVQSKLV